MKTDLLLHDLRQETAKLRETIKSLRNQLAAKSGQPARIKDLLEKVDELEERLAAETEAFNVGQVDIEKLKSQLTPAQEEGARSMHKILHDVWREGDNMAPIQNIDIAMTIWKASKGEGR